MTQELRVEYVERLDSIAEKICDYQQVLIYGAGEVAVHFCNFFYKTLKGKIVRIVQTNADTFKSICGIGVNDSSCLKNCDDENSIVIIATHENAQREIAHTIWSLFEGNIVCLRETFINDLIFEDVMKHRLNNGVLSVSYADIPNMGDQLNPFILKNIFGYSVCYENSRYCNMAGIGSGLGDFFREKKALYYASYPVSIVGMGFLNDVHLENMHAMRNMKFYGVRGYKTLNKLEDFYGKEINCTIGDPGLLTYFLSKNVDKKYSIGIIPHWRELDLKVYKDLEKDLPNSLIIDVTKETESVLKKIEECEAIISSSLHGCIVADAFGVPNILVKMSERPLGDGFKYSDYYSIFGEEYKVRKIGEYGKVSLKRIENEYFIDRTIVKDKAYELKEMFKKCITEMKQLNSQ